MRMHDWSASAVTRGFAPPESRRLRGQRGCNGWGSNPFLQGAAGNAASLTPTASGIARGVKGYKELASVTDDIGGDWALFVRAHAF